MLIRRAIRCFPSLGLLVANHLRQRCGPVAINVRQCANGFTLSPDNNGRRFRVLTVVDDYTRQCFALVIDTSLSGSRVGRELDQISKLRGRPAMIVSGNGTELTSHAIPDW